VEYPVHYIRHYYDNSYGLAVTPDAGRRQSKQQKEKKK
jgi:hypothetical protein